MSSGNTGIGLAMVAAARGYSLTVVMPDTYSDERKAVMLALGVKLKLTAKTDGPMVGHWSPSIRERAQSLWLYEFLSANSKPFQFWHC